MKAPRHYEERESFYRHCEERESFYRHCEERESFYRHCEERESFYRHCEERSNPGANQDSGLLHRLAMTGIVSSSLRGTGIVSSSLRGTKQSRSKSGRWIASQARNDGNRFIVIARNEAIQVQIRTLDCFTGSQ